MEAELKKKWIDALRSGEYKQGPGRLVHTSLTGGKLYCCLGVLCDVSPDFSDGGEDRFFYGISRYGSTTTLPLTAQEDYGLDKIVEFQKKRMSLQDKLISLNDDSGYGFNQIADYLEGIEF